MKLYTYSVRQFSKAGPILCAAHVMADNPAQARARAEAEFRQPTPQIVKDEAPALYAAVEAQRLDAIRTGFAVVVALSKAKNPADWV